MWRYIHTDEMFVNNKNTLYHSDVYLGKDFSDGIRHWKYIKREKKNGRWVYYYNDDNLISLKKERDNNLAALKEENIRRKYGNDANSYLIVNGKKVGNDKVYTKLKQDAIYTSGNYSFAKYKSDKRKNRYNRWLIKPLNKISSTVHKGKKLLSKIFGK